MSKRLVAMLVGVVALAVIAGGCGGGDDDALTKAEFIKRGDAICKKIGTKSREEFDRAATKFLREGGTPNRARGNEQAERFLIPARQAQIEGVRDLSPPSDDEDEISAMLDDAEEAVEESEASPKIIFYPKTDPFVETDKLMKEYGFKVCGSI